MKKVLVIIHGANALSSKNKYLQMLISFTYKHIFNFIPKYFTANPWPDCFSESEFEAIDLKWSGKMIPYDARHTSKKLLHILDSRPNEAYVFLTESIGTEIALLAIEKSQAKNVLLISLCPVNRPRVIRGFSMVSIKSTNDIFARFSTLLLWPFQFHKSMGGNVEMVLLKDIRHDQFLSDLQISENQTLLEFIQDRMNRL